MYVDNDWKQLRDRARRYTASVVIGLASSMMRLSHRLYRAGLLNLTAAKSVMRWSDGVWQVGWSLMKRKHARHERHS